MESLKKLLSKSNYSFIYCLPLAFAFAAAPAYIEEGSFQASPSYFLMVCLHFIGFMATDFGARFLIRRYVNRTLTLPSYTALDRLLKKRLAVLLIAAIIFVCWLPSLIPLYPGSVINDTWGQLKQFMDFQSGLPALYDHHPVLSTLIMGWIIVTLQTVLYDWHLCFFIYVMIQALLTSLAFATTILYAYRRLKIGRSAALFMLVLYCLLPIYPPSIQTISKDALSAWGFVLFAILYMEGVRSEGQVLSSVKYLLGLIITALFCSLTKKVNPYVTLLSLLAMFLFIRRKRLFLCIPIAAISLVMFVLLPNLFAAYGVEPGGKQEMFSLPFQMTARYAEEHPDDYTPEETRAIDNLLGLYDLAERYNPVCADDVKGYWELGETEQYRQYLHAWYTQGLRHPDTYIQAMNAMLAGWFSFEEYDPTMDMGAHSQLNGDYFLEYITYRDEPFDATAEVYQDLYHGLYNIPVLNLIITYGLYAILIPVFSLWTAITEKCRRGKRYWIALCPMFASLFLGCFLAPVSIYGEGRRYLYPLTYTMPLMIAWCIFICKQSALFKKDCKQAEDS